MNTFENNLAPHRRSEYIHLNKPSMASMVTLGVLLAPSCANSERASEPTTAPSTVENNLSDASFIQIIDGDCNGESLVVRAGPSDQNRVTVRIERNDTLVKGPEYVKTTINGSAPEDPDRRYSAAVTLHQGDVATFNLDNLVQMTSEPELEAVLWLGDSRRTTQQLDPEAPCRV